MNEIYKDKRNGRLVVIQRHVTGRIVIVKDIKFSNTYMVELSNLQRATLRTKDNKTVD